MRLVSVLLFVKTRRRETLKKEVSFHVTSHYFRSPYWCITTGCVMLNAIESKGPSTILNWIILSDAKSRENAKTTSSVSLSEYAKKQVKKERFRQLRLIPCYSGKNIWNWIVYLPFVVI